MNYWWTSDYHLSHYNIIKYCDRPFNKIEKMNEVIIDRYNEKVKNEDIVFFLGDFIFKSKRKFYYEIEKKMNGKVIFLKGNHDRNNNIITKMYIYYDSKNICMTHNPKNADSNVPINLCGHVHQRYKIKRLNENSLIVNVSVDVWDYYPVSFNDISSAISKFLRKDN